MSRRYRHIYFVVYRKNCEEKSRAKKHKGQNYPWGVSKNPWKIIPVFLSMKEEKVVLCTQEHNWYQFIVHIRKWTFRYIACSCDKKYMLGGEWKKRRNWMSQEVVINLWIACIYNIVYTERRRIDVKEHCDRLKTVGIQKKFLHKIIINANFNRLLYLSRYVMTICGFLHLSI